jgi:NADPH:quinone reductase-like Zn-dependent oxidoreductase
MSHATMRAAVFRAAAPEGIALESVPRPEPGPGEARLRVLAAALNHTDLFSRDAHADDAAPFWGGADVVGVVDALGPGAQGVAPGARVVANPALYCGTCARCAASEESECLAFGILGSTRPGALAEYVCVAARDLVAVPPAFDARQAAAAPLVYQTAWRGLLTRGGLKAGETVLITGASGGAGLAAVQVAKLAGARVFALTSAAKAERVRAFGADRVFVRDTGEPWEAIRIAAPAGVDLAFDGAGAPYWPPLLELLRNGGRLVSYGRTAGQAAALDVRPVFWRQLSIIGSTMGSRRDFAAVMAAVFAGRLVPPVDGVYPLTRTGEAFARLAAARQVGKLVIEMGPE